MLQENFHLLLTENSKRVRVLDSKADYQLVIEDLFDLKSRNGDLILVDTNRSLEDFFMEFRSFFDVHVAAGGVVKNHEGEYLFIFRRNKWDLPKGHQEEFETMEQTALREVQEECGLENLEITAPLPTTYHLYMEQGHRVFKETHWFMMTLPPEPQKPCPQAEEGITRALWLQKKDFPMVRANTYDNLLAVMDAVEENDDR